MRTLQLPPSPQNQNDEVDCWSARNYGPPFIQHSSWLIFLEFLTICEAQSHKGYPPLYEEKIEDENGGPWPFTYSPAQRLRLRNILSNRIEEKIEKENSGLHDSAKWELWEREMRSQCEGFQAPYPSSHTSKNTFTNSVISFC